jgi:DNA-binding NarL/FixJ family response regulator
MIKVIIVHQAKLIANIIASVLSEEADIHVVGTAGGVDEAMGKMELSSCNMVLAAASLPNDGALFLSEAIPASYPQTKVLIIGVPKSENVILQYVMAGASGYVLQDVPVEGLLDNVRAAHQDKALISPDIAAALMNQVAALAHVSSQYDLNPQAVEDLTSRELDVLNLIGEDLTNQEIAERLVIEVGTVKNHVHNILRKLDVSSRKEAASYLSLLPQGEDES